MELADEIEAIRADNISGSQSITRRAGAIAREQIRRLDQDEEGFRGALLEIGAALITAQPVMASLFNLFNGLLLKLEDCAGRGDSPRLLSDFLEDFAGAMTDHNHSIAERFCGSLSAGTTVFTHSDSSTLRTALEYGRDARKQFSVVCTESRPACEGARLARALSTSGVRTCLVTDSLVFSLLREQRANSVVLVGADAVACEGIINKAGTCGLAVAAQSWGVPFYVVAGSEKLLPAGFVPGGAIQDKPPEEILSAPPKGLRIINRYFDFTPLDSVTAVISERGFVETAQLSRELQRLPVHAGLRAALDAMSTS